MNNKQFSPFLNAEVFTFCLNLAETSFTEHMFKKEVNPKSVDKGLESQIPVWKEDIICSMCSHLFTIDAAFGFCLSIAASGSTLRI